MFSVDCCVPAFNKVLDIVDSRCQIFFNLDWNSTAQRTIDEIPKLLHYVDSANAFNAIVGYALRTIYTIGRNVKTLLYPTMILQMIFFGMERVRELWVCRTSTISTDVASVRVFDLLIG